jgi:hypothetical protein
VVDLGGRLVGKVDDLELEIDPSGVLKVAALLQGPGALGPRFGGRLGEWIVGIWRRLRSEAEPTPRRIPLADVVAIDSVVHLGRTVEKSEGELWAETYVVGRIPGRWA